MIVDMGRSRARGSPSNRTSRCQSAATGGMKRMTVPASPQSTSTGAPGVPPAVRSPGVISQSAPNVEVPGTSSIRVPSARSAAAMR
jgi:hypothetical protein